MSSSRPALGRGLSALIPKTGGGSAPGVEAVDIDLIVPNPEQPRMRFDPESLEELAASIRQHGVLQPVIVTQIASDMGVTTYQLIAGERRLQAARMAGLERMPVVIREAAGKDLLELALVENVMRQDLNPIEEAIALQRLVDEFRLTQDEISARIGRGRVAIANRLRLLSLEEDIRVSIASGQVSEGHARALLTIGEARLRLDTWRKIVADGLTVRDVEQVARALQEMQPSARAKPASPATSATDPHVRAIEDDLRQALGSPVAVKKRGRGGSIVIRFHDDAELEGIITRITMRR